MHKIIPMSSTIFVDSEREPAAAASKTVSKDEGMRESDDGQAPAGVESFDRTEPASRECNFSARESEAARRFFGDQTGTQSRDEKLRALLTGYAL